MQRRGGGGQHAGHAGPTPTCMLIPRRLAHGSHRDGFSEKGAVALWVHQCKAFWICLLVLRHQMDREKRDSMYRDRFGSERRCGCG